MRGVASSSSHANSASAAARRQSLYGTEDCVVLDVGSSVLKLGLSAEPRPRHVVRSLATATPPHVPLLHTAAEMGWSEGHAWQRSEARQRWMQRDRVEEMALWHPDLARTSNEEERYEVEALLTARITYLLRDVYTRLLLTDPKQRKVIVVENPMLPSIVKQTLYKVLFNSLQVPSVSFVPAPVLSLLATGRLTGLVLDVGHHESTLVPVFCGRPLFGPPGCARTTPLGGRRLTRRLRALLRLYGRYYAPLPTSASSARGDAPSPRGTSSSLSAASASASTVAARISNAAPHMPSKVRLGSIPPELLTFRFVDDVKCKALLVGRPLPASPSSQRAAEAAADPEPEDEEWLAHADRELEEAWSSPRVADQPHARKPPQPADVDAAAAGWDSARKLASVRRRFAGQKAAADMAVAVPRVASEPLAPLSAPSTLAALGGGGGGGGGGDASATGGGSVGASAAPPLGRGTVVVPGWVRSRATELFFDDGDEDEESLVEMVLECLLKLPVDLRRTMAANILVTGGTAMLPNFAHRLRQELHARLDEARHAAVAMTKERSEAAAAAAAVAAAAADSTHVALSMARVGQRPPKSARASGARRLGEADEGAEVGVAGATDDADVGAAEAGREAPATKTAAASASRRRSGRRGAAWRYLPLARLADDVQVLNDHSPPIDAETREAYGGSAPALNAHTLAWLGASLAGSLRTGSTTPAAKESWDAAELLGPSQAGRGARRLADGTWVVEGEDASASTRRGRAGQEARYGGSAPGGGDGVGGGVGGLGGADGTGVLVGSYGAGRGSFVGIVGGIDTGAYGGLAAISRRIEGGLTSPSRP